MDETTKEEVAEVTQSAAAEVGRLTEYIQEHIPRP